MGTSPSKPQYYAQSGYPTQGSSHANTYAYPSQGQFGYYYQQVGNDPTQVQAIPGYYYQPVKQGSRRKHSSNHAHSNTKHRSPRQGERSGAPVAATSASPTGAAPPAQPVQPTEPPTDSVDQPEAPPQVVQDAPPEAPAEASAPANEHDMPTSEPAPAPAPEQAAPAPAQAASAPAQIASGLTNPLPIPPRDVFNTDPYRHLRRPQTTGVSGTWNYYSAPVASVSYKPHLRSQYRPKKKDVLRPPRPHEELKRKEKRSTGTGGGAFNFLRSFTMPSMTTKKKNKSRSVLPFLPPGAVHMSYPPNTSGPQGSIPVSSSTTPAPPAPLGTPVIVPLHSPLNPTSSHKILYKKKLYPTAAHLFEAQKFLKHSPELAERIRTSNDNAAEMSMLSRAFQADGMVRQDWQLVWRDKMDEVLYMKFTQHPDLRAELMATGYAPLLDGNEARQPDAAGVNELGKALVRLRERLRREGAR